MHHAAQDIPLYLHFPKSHAQCATEKILGT